MSKGRRTRLLIVVLLVLALLTAIVYSTLPATGDSVLTAPFTSLFRPIARTCRQVKDGVSDYFATARTNAELRQANRKLLQDNVELRLVIKQNDNEAKAYEKIKAAFQLKDRFNYGLIAGAQIISRPLNEGFDFYLLDKGSSDGLDLSTGQAYPVVDAEANLFGRIYSTDPTTAKLLPILHEGFAASCSTSGDSSNLFRLRGDQQLKHEGLCVIDNIPEAAKLKLGDTVVTSGRGGIFPRGIPVGRVVEFLKADENGLRRAIVQPFVQIQDIETVFILQGQSEGQSND